MDVEGVTDIFNLNTSGYTFFRYIQADNSLAIGQNAGAALADVNDGQFNVFVGDGAGQQIAVIAIPLSVTMPVPQM